MTTKPMVDGQATEEIKDLAKIDTHLCPRYEKATNILGKRWTGLILMALMNGPRRFNELHKMIELVSDRLLTERLRDLERDGLLVRTVTVNPDSPVRIEYSLTEKGYSMRKVLDAIQDWAEEWVVLDQDEGDRDK